jgi:Metallo-peptidase family M12B Reprolysin-like/Cadherin-like/Secretion system C-terminal sorting domain
MKKNILSLLFACLCSLVMAQTNNFWTIQTAVSNSNDLSLPNKYYGARLDLAQLKTTLQSAATISLPMPDGSMEEFLVHNSPVMEAGLAARYPDIQSFAGRSVQHPSFSMRCDYGLLGFHAFINMGDGSAVVIEPTSKATKQDYMVYYLSDLKNTRSAFPNVKQCGVENQIDETTLEDHAIHLNTTPKFRGDEPVQLRKYRMALATTGEYSKTYGTTVAEVLSHLVEVMSITNAVFERDLAIHFDLIDNEDKLVFLNPDSDGLTNGDANAMHGENSGIINALVGSQAYDIGHSIGYGITAAGSGGQVTIGLASLQCICKAGAKAQGASNNPGGAVAGFVTQVMNHEMGHQFGANHTFNSCGQNGQGGAGYEVGGGNTIMAYDVCGGNNIPASVIPNQAYFHVASLEEMINYSRTNTGNVCAKRVDVLNHHPNPTIPNLVDNFYIPQKTPFKLVGKVTDLEGDSTMTHSWEQFDLGPESTLGMPMKNAPSFIAYTPAPNSQIRYFPKLNDLVNNKTTKYEVLPDHDRNLTFRFVAKDNFLEAGGQNWAQIAFKATTKAGPFLVKSPNIATTWSVNDYTEVQWDVANTNAAPVNCKNVNILLSLDGGFTYPDTLVKNTPNDGSEFVLVPNKLTTKARVMVQAADNIFFDISDKNITIAKPIKDGFSFGIFTDNMQVCLPNTANLVVQTTVLGAFTNHVVYDVVDGLPQGAVAAFTEADVLPTEKNWLVIDMSNVQKEGNYTIKIRAIAPNADTVYRSVLLTLVSNNFTKLQQLSPKNGKIDESTGTSFRWKKVTDANKYEIEIATSPVFGSTIVDKGETQDSVFIPNITFLENTTYYWRIRPVNECGAGEALVPYAFHTVALNCKTFDFLGANLVVSAGGTSESVLEIEENGIISDVNVSTFKGSHKSMLNLTATLVGPTGKTANLLKSKCSIQTINFNAGFDDESTKDFPCLLNNNGSFKPSEPLSVFDNDSTKGVWKLRLKSTAESGKVADWGLKFCYSLTLKHPIIAKNTLFAVAPAKARLITNEFMLATDENNSADQLIYTLVTVPKNGKLYFGTTELKIGDTFRQSNIDANSLKYVHSGNNSVKDGFFYTVQDIEGGFVGTPEFKIVIDPTAPVLGTNDTQFLDANVRLYPNPTTGQVTLSFLQGIEGTIQVEVWTMQGQRLSQQTATAKETLNFDLSDKPSGFYLIKIQTDKGILTKRLVVGR